MTDFRFGLTPGDVVYDIETYPNLFTLAAEHVETDKQWFFEVSPRRNDYTAFRLFIEILQLQHCRMVGYNNLSFDYPVIHFGYMQDGCNAEMFYRKAMSIIDAPHHARFSHLIWDSDQLVPQLDLYKVRHYDNPSKATSLKILEFNMRMESIEETPVEFGVDVPLDLIPEVKFYNQYDVGATKKFHRMTKSLIRLREELDQRLDLGVLNASDVKLGEKILVKEMESRGIKCFEYIDGKRKKRQTQRQQICLADVVFPYVQFERPEFNAILNQFRNKTLKSHGNKLETKGVFEKVHTNVEGLDYHFGTGGLHASISSQIVESDEHHQIVDVDVASYYPNLGIQNNLFPAHLGQEFCHAYLGVYHTRKEYPKGSPENEAYKLALNGAYGGSNNEHSPFYDPFYTMSITINGQMLLCMLAEQLIKTPGLKMIQCNTDGVTYLCPRQHLDHTRNVCKWWEQLTKLELEEALYSRMFIRDVNSYIAEKEDRTLKRIGAYAHVTELEKPGTRELPFHKDWSFRVIPLAAEAALVRGEDIGEFIRNHPDTYDFFGRTKVPRNSELQWGGEKVSNIVRYYLSNTGKPLDKVMPPAGPIGAYKRANGLTEAYYRSILSEVGDQWDERIHTKNKSIYTERRIGLQSGYNVQLSNSSIEIDRNDINYDWYIAETKKLVEPLR